jgi:hypothetical protein
MEEAGESRGGRLGEGVILTRCETASASAPTHYSITASKSNSTAHWAPSWAQSHASPFNYVGRRRGRAKMSGPLVNGSSHANYGAFSISIYYFITTWPRRHLQPSTLFASINFNPCLHFIPLQLQSSLPTSSLVAANINHCRHSNFKPHHYVISSPSP